ncbi:MAG: Carboxypeptidase regulatory-like domain [Thermoplasmata archaeon]|nr:Carboxypeptidase regulatory-like domain [Thermoplasmata archaeon]
MMRAPLAALLTAFLFAGCTSSSPPAADEAPVDFEALDLEATATTGLIRGLVVDSAIRPVAGATVSLRMTPPQTATTTGEGAFGFDGLEAGTYFLTVHKPGFIDVQQSTEVVAGVSEPALVKVLLAVDGAFIAPYFEVFVLDGFIECGVTTPVVAGAVCSFGEIAGLYNLTNDRFGQFIAVANVPMWLQHELVWDATQNTGNMLNLAARTATAEQYDGGSYEAGIAGKAGTSPVVIQVNATRIEEREVGLNGTGLAPAVFAGGMEGTNPCSPPVPCLFATGATIEQKFSLYTILFYGYTPPVDWRFSSGDPVPPPPQ